MCAYVYLVDLKTLFFSLNRNIISAQCFLLVFVYSARFLVFEFRINKFGSVDFCLVWLYMCVCVCVCPIHLVFDLFLTRSFRWKWNKEEKRNITRKLIWWLARYVFFLLLSTKKKEEEKDRNKNASANQTKILLN